MTNIVTMKNGRFTCVDIQKMSVSCPICYSSSIKGKFNTHATIVKGGTHKRAIPGGKLKQGEKMAHQETLSICMEGGHLVNRVQLFRGSNKTTTTCFKTYLAEVGLGQFWNCPI